MKKWQLSILALMSAAVMLLAGCGGEPPEEEPEPAPEVSVPPVIDVDVSQLLPAEEVASALGVEAVTVQIYEDGLWVHYATEDNLTTADVHIDKCEREYFDMLLTQYTELQEAPNLGEAAQWSPETKELLAYGQGSMVVVVSDIPEASDDTLLVASRQMVALLLENLAD